MDEPVIPFDLARMFLGDEPPLFLLEIAFRTAVIYLYSLGMVRWVGGRGVAQLSLVEFLLVIALGSAVGDAAFYPEVPLLHAMLVITLVVLINKALDLLIQRHDTAKDLIDGKPVEILRDGRLCLDGLARRNLGTAEVMASLRIRGVRNLGTVELAFMEADGGISLFHADVPRPGLPIVPPAEIAAPPRAQDPAGAPGGMVCCLRCGGSAAAAAVLPDGACGHCGARGWTPAVDPGADRGAGKD